jgi:UDP-glucose 4-epimerase
MRALVTGGAGFIGSNLVRGLLERGEEVRVLDNFSTGKRENLAGILAEAELVEGDLRRPDQVRAATRGVELVFHHGARPSVPLSLRDPVTTSSVNVEGTRNVLAAARGEDVRRVVLASSSSIYGNSGALPRCESDRPDLLSPYASSKLLAERLAVEAGASGSPDTVMLRYFNVFGPNQDHLSPYAAVIPRFICALAAGEPVPVHGDGAQLRDFTYVADVVDANLLAAEAAGVNGEVLNVAGGRPLTINALAQLIGEVLDRPVERRHLPVRPAEVRDSWADIEKAGRLLGYRPRVTLEHGVRATAHALLGEAVGAAGAR